MHKRISPQTRILQFGGIWLVVTLLAGCGRTSPSSTPPPPAADSPTEPTATQTVVEEPRPDDPAILAASHTDYPEYLPKQEPHSGYISSAACLECHPDEHESWSHSYHRTMTQVVSGETVASRFDGQTQRIYDWEFTPEKRGEQFWCRLDATDGSGASYEYQLVMSTGSHHMQKYWYHTGTSRKMGMSPMVYLIEADRWMPESSAFLSPPDHRLRLREGAWNTGCIQCHSTGAHPRISSAAEMDPLVAEFGIACEACHGPGQQHAQDKTAATIVNPSSLPATQRAQICGQCHGAWLKVASANSNWAQTGHEFRPGEDLFQYRYYPHGAKDRHLFAKLKAEESFWPDGENRVAGREMHGLLSSPCFAHEGPDDRRMTCISCHDMHSPDAEKNTWANDQLGAKMEGNDACLQCHQKFQDDLASHTHHDAESAGSLCYNCHMPHTSYGLLKAVRSHTVTSPSASVTVDTGRPNACNQCHLDETLEWTAFHLTDWYDQPTVNLSSDHRKIAASILWAVQGDAAQRALMAWSMGWQDALEASGDHWQVFYLVNLMFDDYDAIRYIAYRSLRQIAGFDHIEYDHLNPAEERPRVMAEVLAAWNQKLLGNGLKSPTAKKLLYDEQGEIRFTEYENLKRLRDNRPIVLTE